MNKLEEIKLHDVNKSTKDIAWAISEIERLKKEKEWLLNRITRNYGDKYSKIRVEELNEEMQQALEED